MIIDAYLSACMSDVKMTIILRVQQNFMQNFGAANFLQLSFFVLTHWKDSHRKQHHRGDILKGRATLAALPNFLSNLVHRPAEIIREENTVKYSYMKTK